MIQDYEKNLPLKPSQTKKYLNIGIFVLILVSCMWFANFNIIKVIVNFWQGFRIIGDMFFPPKWSYFDGTIVSLGETIQMAIVGSVVGAIVAFPVSLLAANNFIKIKWLNNLTRIILNIFRTIPALVLASLFVAVFGIGSFSGTLALAIFSFGLISKMTYESIESIDLGQVEAIDSVGGNKLEILKFAILPQVLPQYLSYTLYAFEVNVRAAAVLGYVGAGGIGQKYQIYLTLRRYDYVGTIVIVSFFAVLIIDAISSSIRRRLV